MENNQSILSKKVVMIMVVMLCCLLWGSAFSCIKIGYKIFNISSRDMSSQILFAGIRFIIAGTMVVIVESIRNKKFVRPSHPKYIMVQSAFQTVIQYLFFYIGLAHTTGVKSSIITGSGTFFTLLVCSLLFKQEKLTSKKIIGTLVGFLGLILVNISGKSLDFDLSIMGEGFILIAAFSGAIAQGYIKKFSKDANVVMLSGYQFFFGGIVMSLVGLIFGGSINRISISGVILIVYMGFISAMAYTLWSLLLKYNDVSKVATCKFMNPIFGAILSYFLVNEKDTMGPHLIVALILVSVGIYIVNKKNIRPINNIKQ